MAQVENADVLGRFLQGFDTGIERKQQSRLLDMRESAFAAEQDAAAKKQAGEDRDRQLATLQQTASLYGSAPDMLKPHLYGQIVDLAEGIGFAPKGQLPRQLTPEVEPKFQQFLQSFAGIGKQPAESFTLAPGSARYGADGRVIASQPFAPEKQDFVLSPDGTQWLPKPLGRPQQGAPAAARSMMGQAFYDEIGQLISPYGATVGSTNGGEHNRGSLHYDGRALDIPLGASATDAVRANADRIIADLSGRGYKVRDERTRPAGQQVWGGPHLHVEAPPQASNGGAIPIPGATPRTKERDAPSGYQWAPDGQSLVPIAGGPADRKNNPTAPDLAKGEMALRKELTDRVKEPRSVLNMYQKVQAAAGQPSAANDLALIFAYMKMLDPGSVVREQEFANAQNAAGVPDQVQNAWNKALRGERLNENQRRQFVTSASQIASAAGQQITNATREYQGLADQYGYDSGRATGMADFRDVQGGVASAPSTGGASASGWSIKVKP